MDHWLKAGNDMLDLALGSPPTDLERRVILLLSFLVCVFVLKLTCQAMGATNAGIGPSVLVSLLGFFLILACLTAAKLSVPRPFYREHHAWLLPLVASALSIAVIAPLISRLMRIGYVGALVSWAAGILVVAAIVLIAGSGFDSILSAGKASFRVKKRRHAYEEVLNGR